MRKCKKNYKALSLAELVLAIALFGIISSFLVLIVVDATRAFSNTQKRSEATNLTNEIYSALKLLKTDEWFIVTQHTGMGPKHLTFTDGKYEILDGEGEKDGLKYSFTVDFAKRDNFGNLNDEGEITDPHTRVIALSIEWTDNVGKKHTVSPKLYMNDWHVNTFTFTDETDFKKGTHTETTAANVMGGELRLQSIFYPNWCRPERSMSEYDIPGSATARSVFARQGYAYLGTRGELTGEPFTKLIIEGVNPITLTVEGTFSGYAINEIYVEGDYAYLATTDDDKEVVILDISSLPYTEVGYVNTPGSWNAHSVFVKGNIGYVSHSTYVSTFNLDQKTGQRNILNTINVSLFPWIAAVSQIYVKDNYLYGVLNWDWYEFAIIDVTNPHSMKLISRTSVNNQQVYDMYISEDGNRAYFGTNISNYEDEFFIIDISTKKGARPIIASVNTDMTVRALSVVEGGNVAILVGTGGQEYQVYNIAHETNPIKCGGMQIDNGIYDIDSLTDPQGNAFSYIVTGDTNNEFKIIRGGPGGGDEDTGNGYVPSGNYLSIISDSKSTNSTYYSLYLLTQIPEGTSMEIQYRVSDSPTMAGAQWRGPDGTPATFFSTTGVYFLPEGTKGRYFQYKVNFTGDTVSTPLLEELVVSYEK